MRDQVTAQRLLNRAACICAPLIIERLAYHFAMHAHRPPQLMDDAVCDTWPSLIIERLAYHFAMHVHRPPQLMDDAVCQYHGSLSPQMRCACFHC